MLSWPLEDWLTEEGDRVVHLRADGAHLSTVDCLLFEIWLLDTESRNGGLSQYFFNRGVEAWQRCAALAIEAPLPSFVPFKAELESIILGKAGPYLAINELGAAAEDLWSQHAEGVVGELQAYLARVS